MNGNTSFSPSCTRYESAIGSLNGSYEETVRDGSFLSHEANGASGGSAGDTITSLGSIYDPLTPRPPAKSRVSVFKQFDPYFKTPLGSSRNGTLAESPADMLPYDGPLVPITPVAPPAAPLATVSVTAGSPAFSLQTVSPIAAAAVAQSPVHVNGTTTGTSDALETISILKAANEDLLTIVSILEDKIASLTEDKEKLQSKLRSIITSLSSD